MGFTCSDSFAAAAASLVAVPPDVNSAAAAELSTNCEAETLLKFSDDVGITGAHVEAAGTTPEMVTGDGSVDFTEAQGEAAAITAGS